MNAEAFEREGREDREEERADGRPPFNPALMRHKEVPEDVENIVRTVIGCAIEVHRHLGPGLLEKLYEDALVYELKCRSIRAAQQVEIQVVYKDTILRGQRLDLVVAGVIVVEVKSVQAIADVHNAQLLSYVRAIDAPVGLLLNFNVPMLVDGIRRVFNERWSRRVPASQPPLSDCLSSRSSRPSRSK